MPASGHETYPLTTTDKIRYADTDRQGHVNNAVFSSFLETGRVEILYSPEVEALEENTAFVIAKVCLEYHKPLFWPGEVIIATGIERIGNRSLDLRQTISQNDVISASAGTTIIQVDAQEGRPVRLSPDMKNYLRKFTVPRGSRAGRCEGRQGE